MPYSSPAGLSGPDSARPGSTTDGPHTERAQDNAVANLAVGQAERNPDCTAVSGQKRLARSTLRLESGNQLQQKVTLAFERAARTVAPSDDLILDPQASVDSGLNGHYITRGETQRIVDGLADASHPDAVGKAVAGYTRQEGGFDGTFTKAARELLQRRFPDESFQFTNGGRDLHRPRGNTHEEAEAIQDSTRRWREEPTPYAAPWATPKNLLNWSADLSPAATSSVISWGDAAKNPEGGEGMAATKDVVRRALDLPPSLPIKLATNTDGSALFSGKFRVYSELAPGVGMRGEYDVYGRSGRMDEPSVGIDRVATDPAFKAWVLAAYKSAKELPTSGEMPEFCFNQHGAVAAWNRGEKLYELAADSNQWRPLVPSPNEQEDRLHHFVDATGTEALSFGRRGPVLYRGGRTTSLESTPDGAR